MLDKLYKTNNILIFIFFIIVLFPVKIYANSNFESNKSYYFHGIVMSIIEDNIDKDNLSRYQKIKVMLTDNDIKGKELIVENYINEASIYKYIVKKNDEIIIIANKSGEKLINARVYGYLRDKYLKYLFFIFIFLLLILGGKKGILSFISLIISLAIILFIFLPLILQQFNPIVVAIGVCIAITLVTLFTVGGISVKTLASVIGTSGGVAVAACITFYFGNLSRLIGINNSEVELLSYLPQSLHLDFKKILFAGIIIGALGAVMDVSISISSSMDEIYKTDSSINRFKLIFAGLNIGKDIMGTMANTLILAYTGSSINIFLVFFVYGLSFTEFINEESIAAEIIRSLSGSIGLLMTIPITALTYGLLISNKTNKRRHRR